MTAVLELVAVWFGCSVAVAGAFAALNLVGRRRQERARCHDCGRPVRLPAIFCAACLSLADAVDAALAPDVCADLIPAAARPVPPTARRRDVRNTNPSKGEAE